jgi:hypothetical protein
MFPDPDTEYEQTDFTIEQIAEHWKGVKGCSLSNLMKLSAMRNWSERRKIFRRKLAEETATRTAAKAGETLASMNMRHIHFYRYLQREALKALGFPFAGEDPPEKRLVLSTAAQAVHALDVSIRGEQLIRETEPEEGVPSLCLICDTTPPVDRLREEENDGSARAENGDEDGERGPDDSAQAPDGDD